MEQGYDEIVQVRMIVKKQITRDPSRRRSNGERFKMTAKCQRGKKCRNDETF